MKKATTWKGELIGHEISVINSDNISVKGIQGKVVDETKNMITIQTEHTIKKLIKNQITIKIDNETIHGKQIMGRIEERIKK